MRDALDAAEVVRLLEAATSLQDKLLLGLLVGTDTPLALTVSLRWMDLDLVGRTFVASGAPLPSALVPILERLGCSARPVDYVFAVPPPRRHLSPGDCERAIARTAVLAGLPGRITARTLAATDGRLLGARVPTRTVLRAEPTAAPPAPAPGATMRLSFEIGPPEVDGTAKAAVLVHTPLGRVRLDGIVIEASSAGVTDVYLPPRESWRLALDALDPAARRRVEAPRFYRVVVTEITRRLAARASRRDGRLHRGAHRVDQVLGGERLG